MTSLPDSVANIPVDFRAFSANTAGTAARSSCRDSSLVDYTTSAGLLQTGRGHQGFKFFLTLTCRKQGQKANITLYLKYVFVYHSFFTEFICNILGILFIFFF